MASREGFRKLLKRYNYQVDRVALDQQVAICWAQLKPEQRAEVQKEEYRARIWAAGYEAGQWIGSHRADKRMELAVEVLNEVAEYMDLPSIEPVADPLPGSLEHLAGQIREVIVRYGEQP